MGTRTGKRLKPIKYVEPEVVVPSSRVPCPDCFYHDVTRCLCPAKAKRPGTDQALANAVVGKMKSQTAVECRWCDEWFEPGIYNEVGFIGRYGNACEDCMNKLLGPFTVDEDRY